MVKFYSILIGMVTSLMAWGEDSIILPQDLVLTLKAHEYDILDVRTEEEYLAGRIAGSVWVPHDLVGQVAGFLAQSEKPLVIYCHSGRRSRLAAKTLQQKGVTRKILFLEGDYPAWEMFLYPKQTGDVLPEENLQQRAKQAQKP